MSIKSIFSKVKSNSNELSQANSKNTAKLDSSNVQSNWIKDRYSSVIIQRNLMFIVLVLMLILTIVSVLEISKISSLYTVKPFVIEVEKKTGITNIVNPASTKILSNNEALAQYFVMRYIRSRESYCNTDFKYNYLTVVRLLSTDSVYSEFRQFINSNNSPITLYGKVTCTGVKLRSIQFFSDVDQDTGKNKNTAVVRFTLHNSFGPIAIKIHKISSLEYQYRQMKLTLEERNVNPLGFQVMQYRVDNEILKNN